MRGIHHLAAAVAATMAGAGLGVAPQLVIEEKIAPGPSIRRARNLPQSRLNRSRHWDYAETYKEARAISPFPFRPVR